MADFQVKICEKINIRITKIRLTMPRVKMSRADRNPWLAKMIHSVHTFRILKYIQCTLIIIIKPIDARLSFPFV
jgi:hypothetical protein